MTPPPLPPAPQRWGVTHTTRFVYSVPVADSVNEVRLQPLQRPGQQQVEAFTLRTEPAAPGRVYADFFGNTVQYLEVTAPHSAFEVVTEATVVVTPPAGDPGAGRREAVEDLPFEVWVDYIGASALTSTSGAVQAQAEAVVPELNEVAPAALALMAWVHGQLVYVPGITTVQTAAEEVLEHGRGVCQDFAHVFLSLCRSLRIPARYVSGYLGPGPGQDVGEGAMHAWAEVLVPGHGWWGLDPTLGRPVVADHVVVAVGRDYADVRPISGSYRGGARSEMTVQVLLTRLGSALEGSPDSPPGAAR